MNECLPCAIVAGRIEPPGGIVYAGEHWLVSHSMPPVVLPGMLIVKSRRHCESLAELLPAETAALGPTIQAICATLEAVVKPERCYVCSFGEGVRHVHFFVMPRLPGMPAGSWPMLTMIRWRRLWQRLGLYKAAGPGEIQTLCDQLRAEFRLTPR